MNKTNGGIGEDEMEELTEDDVEEVVFIDDHDVMEEVEEDGDDSSEDEDFESQQADRPEAPEGDDADFVFKKHTGSVFDCSLDPKNCNLAVTGGEDDMAYIWEIENGQVILECKGHKDSVAMVAFSYDGAYVATGDMSGLVQVWKVSTRTLAWSETVGDFSWLQWHHGANVLLCAITSGDLFMWKIPSGECKVLAGHAHTTECGLVMPDGRRAAVGYADGVVKLFELQTCTVQGSIAAHSDQVSSVDAFVDNNIIASGGGDGKVNFYKTKPLKIVWSFNCVQGESATNFVETVRFSKDSSLQLVAVGTLGGNLYILDFTRQVVRHKFDQCMGIPRLVWDHHRCLVYTGAVDGVIRVYDARGGTQRGQLLGHKQTILELCLSTDGNTLLSTSDDQTCRVYAVSPPDR